jgi:hypothetical protein
VVFNGSEFANWRLSAQKLCMISGLLSAANGFGRLMRAWLVSSAV